MDARNVTHALCGLKEVNNAGISKRSFRVLIPRGAEAVRPDALRTVTPESRKLTQARRGGRCSTRYDKSTGKR